MTPTTAPDALLLITSTCPNCQAILESLTRLIKDGALGRLEIINLQQHPEAAEKRQVRSVPWLRIGALEFSGLYSPGELRTWAQEANTAAGLRKYLSEMLTSGQLSSAINAMREHPHFAAATAELLADMETPLEVRVGLTAVFEDLSGDPRLGELIAKLGPLLKADEARVRNDACYLLGLSGDTQAIPLLENCLDDTDAEVRETAREMLDAVHAQGQS